MSKGSAGSSTAGTQGPDPVVVDAPIAYVQRALPRSRNGSLKPDDVMQPAAFNPGAQLILKARASATAAEIAVTEAIFPPLPAATPDGAPLPALYDVKDLYPSRDGKKLLFALRAPTIANVPDDQQPTWDIWEYDRITNSSRPIITDPEVAKRGQDVQPAYLADGRIIFSSTLQQTTRTQNQDALRGYFQGQTEDGQRAAFNLHVINSDGTGLAQITFNPSDDLQPTVLNTGEVVFLRWDRHGHDTLSLYKMNPDGTGLSFYYGYHSQNTGTDNTEDIEDTEAVFNRPRVMPDDRLLVSLRPREALQQGGDMVALDTVNYYENTRALIGQTSAPAATSLTKNSIYTHGKVVEGQASPGGYINSAYPMDDGTGRLLMSWSACRILNPTTQQPRPCTERFVGSSQAEPDYALWMFNSLTQTQLPIVIPAQGVQLVEPVILQDRSILPSPPSALDDTLRTAKQGVLHIQNVNDLGLSAYAGAKYLRLVKNIPLLARQDLPLMNGAFGVGGQGVGMREIVAYAPLEADGSVKLKLPAEVPFMLDLVDAQGKRLGGRHLNWVSLAAGETRECKGCHQANNDNAPHGRLDAEPLSSSGDLAQNKPAQTPSLELPNARYGNLLATLNKNPSDAKCMALPSAPAVWKLPMAETCLTSWSATCAININYLENIQPLWEADRRRCDETGQLIAEGTCTFCHDRSPEHLDQVRQAASPTTLAPSLYDYLLGLDVQIELLGTRRSANDNQVISYNELLRNHNKREYLLGVSQDVKVNMPINQKNPDGTFTLVDNFVPLPQNPPLNLGGALSATNALFFKRFNNPLDRHFELLSADEQRLLAEWLDLGAQYYNEPSKARQPN